MLRNSWILAVLLAFPVPQALADIWECVDANGNKRFTNIKSESKGCRMIDVAAPNVVPGGKPPAKTAESPKNFPKVDKDTQKQRDNDRRKLLEQELANEERLLAQAKKELAEQESIRLGSEVNYQRVLNRLEPYKKNVALHENNVANLKRELAGIR